MRGLTHFSILDDNQPQASAEKDSRSSMRGEVTARPPPTAAVADAATAGTNSTPFNLGRHKRRICTKLLTTKMTCGQPTGISYSTGDKKFHHRHPPHIPSPRPGHVTLVLLHSTSILSIGTGPHCPRTLHSLHTLHLVGIHHLVVQGWARVSKPLGCVPHPSSTS